MQGTFDKARQFMYRNARPLDLARFRFHFESGSAQDVMRVLAEYQNPDGGMGHAVEADCWNPNSTLLHTNTAGEIIREIGWNDPEHPVIRGMVRWLGSGDSFDGKHWLMCAESNNDYPHAPWWHTESFSTCHTDYNGTAQCAGFLMQYAAPDSDAHTLGVRIAQEAIDALDAEEIRDMHTCACYVRLLEHIMAAGAGNIVPADALRAKLRRAVSRLVVRDVSKWDGYNCKPSQFISSRDSEFYEDLRELAEAECDFIVRTQLPDGSWDIPWNWGDRFPAEWAISRNWWKGYNIVLNLLYLKGMGRLEE